MRRLIFIFIGVIFSSLIGCLDPYEPPVTKESADFLVVDGQINATDQVVTVTVTRGVALNSDESNPAVSDATVRIKDSSGTTTSLIPQSPGSYQISTFLPLDREYKLLIDLPDGKAFVSDWITLQQKFPITDLRWEADEENLKFFVSTSANAEGKGPYYFRYGYEETYEYRSVFASDWKLEGPSPIYRTLEENISTCWMTKKSSSALLASTEGLTQNIISDFNVLRIPRGDRRLWFGYSILVKQFAIDQRAYDYWEKLRKVSESLGGLFDPIPFSVSGNIYPDTNMDGEPDAPADNSNRVLGYFSGGEVSSLRINVRNVELPFGYYLSPATNCLEAYVEIGNLQSIIGRDINLTRAQYEGLAIVGFYYGIPACTDCRLEGGTPLKPFFMN